MAVSDPTNERYTTAKQSALTASPRRGVVLHHGATTDMDAIIALETTGARVVSSNRVVKDKRDAKVVDDNMRAWSLSSPYWDSVLRSVECANESTDGWTISAASHETLAQQVAFWSQEDTKNGQPWVPSRAGDNRNWTVYGHREIYTIFGDSYATACPGAMDLDWITARANQILASNEKRSNPMTAINLVDASTLDAKGNVTAKSDLYFMDTGVVFGPYKRGDATPDLAASFNALLAKGHTPFAKSVIDNLAKQYREAGGTVEVGSITVPADPALLEATKAGTAATLALAAKIDALPAEIDRYADGKKQST